jgi:flagellar basal-body rod protein FlgC
MYELVPIEIAGTGMRAQNIRMGVVASNLANARSTRTAEGGPYQRRLVVCKADIPLAFQDTLAQTNVEDLGMENTQHSALSTQSSMDRQSSRWLLEQHLRGVSVPSVERDAGVRLEYDETGNHPDRDANGYVRYPDINVMSEMTDMISASRNYEANLAVIKNSKDMLTQLIDLLRA